MADPLDLEMVAAQLDSALLTLSVARRAVAKAMNEPLPDEDCPHPEREELDPGEWYCLSCHSKVEPPDGHSVSGSPE